MNLLFSCIGKRGYIARFFREILAPDDVIVATSNTPWTSGFRFCDRARLMPDIHSDEYPDAVLQLCHEEKIDAVFSFFDPDVDRLAGFRERFLAAGIVPVFPGAEASHVCFDKYATYQFLDQAGFLTPRTWIDIDEVKSKLASGDLDFPLMVKPRTGFGSALTGFARNELELELRFNAGPDMIVQEAVGGDDFDFDICNDLNGKPVSVVLWRKYKSTLGETENVVTVHDDALLDVGVRLGEAVGHIGPMDVDMFVDADGKPTIIEMNPRFGGGYPVSHLAGADFPGMLLKMIRGEHVEPRIGDYQSGIVMMKSLDVFGGPSADFWGEQLHIASGDLPGHLPKLPENLTGGKKA